MSRFCPILLLIQSLQNVNSVANFFPLIIIVFAESIAASIIEAEKFDLRAPFIDSTIYTEEKLTLSRD